MPFDASNMCSSLPNNPSQIMMQNTSFQDQVNAQRNVNTTPLITPNQVNYFSIKYIYKLNIIYIYYLYYLGYI